MPNEVVIDFTEHPSKTMIIENPQAANLNSGPGQIYRVDAKRQAKKPPTYCLQQQVSDSALGPDTLSGITYTGPNGQDTSQGLGKNL